MKNAAKQIGLGLMLVMLVLSGGARLAQATSDDMPADAHQIARKILETQFGEEARKKAGETLVLVMTPLVLRDNPGKEDAIAPIMQKTVVPTMASGFDEMEKQMEDEYVQNFSVDELKQLLAFDSSSLGVKYKAFNVELLAKLKDSIKVINGNKTQEAMRALSAQLKQNGLVSPKELDR